MCRRVTRFVVCIGLIEEIRPLGGEGKASTSSGYLIRRCGAPPARSTAASAEAPVAMRTMVFFTRPPETRSPSRQRCVPLGHIASLQVFVCAGRGLAVSTRTAAFPPSGSGPTPRRVCRLIPIAESRADSFVSASSPTQASRITSSTGRSPTDGGQVLVTCGIMRVSGPGRDESSDAE